MPSTASAARPALPILALLVDVREPAHRGPVHIHAAVTGGVAGWQITLIAVGTAIAATVAVLLERARAARRQLTTTPA